MLLLGWKQLLDRAALEREPLGEMERLYKTINAKCDPKKPDYDAAIHETAAQELVKLQPGDAENLAIWREMIRLSQQQFDTIYGRLGVKFDHTLGESFYNPRLGRGGRLDRPGHRARKRRRDVVFFDGKAAPKEDPFLIHRDGEWRPNPQLIHKSDGGFNYATTDLATLAYRLETWQPDEIVYVTDGRQQLHFQTAFRHVPHDGIRQSQSQSAIQLAHVWFGSILGEDGKPLKDPLRRDGETCRPSGRSGRTRLQDRFRKEFRTARGAAKEIARVVGLGAVKYADLLPNRQSDYVFSWDKMLALNGNTAPYLQYAYARIQNIFRKNAEHATENAAISLTAPEEIALAKYLLNFGLTLQAVVSDYRPNLLCNYLYELAGGFTRFYENCPVLKADEPARSSRLTLCDLTARVLKQGLAVLGIEVLDQM